jgi:magnesium transporter
VKETIIAPNAGRQLTWIDISNPEETELLSIAEEFNLHPYTVRDSMEVGHLPKIENFDNVTFIITRLYNPREGNPNSIQEMTSKIAIFHGANFVITIHRVGLPFLDEIKKRFQNKPDATPLKIVTHLLWQVIHTYEKPSDELFLEADSYETRIFLKELIPGLQQNLYYLKRKAETIKRMLLLTADVINSVRQGQKNNPFLQDVQDLHVKLLNKYDQVLSNVSNLLNMYLSLSAQRTNEIMKVMTIFSAFFMPLTFIVGVYGMNFHNMPEMMQPWGYAAVWILMITISVIIFLWFRRKRWM